ncbi:hypothetical protein HHI36_009788 [Cryptolaemus montrouzieri]|uniref:Uncharacterized protein n=1 Tax=Cryptolaemus montrouzieri TaxID=559131 RepID=A0ABD2MGV6_9CUCU
MARKNVLWNKPNGAYVSTSAHGNFKNGNGGYGNGSAQASGSGIYRDDRRTGYGGKQPNLSLHGHQQTSHQHWNFCSGCKSKHEFSRFKANGKTRSSWG